MEILIKVPCQRHVAHYLKSSFGDKPLLTHGSHEGKYFLSLLERTHKTRDKELRTFTSLVEVKISYLDFECYGNDLTLTSIKRFNDFIDGILKKHLFDVHMTALVCVAGFKVAPSIRIFQEKYNFPEQVWTFGALKKHYDRHLSHLKPMKAA
ncbi:MAG: hypothetical protein ACPG5W_02595 [Flavobacteriales bacterium]